MKTKERKNGLNGRRNGLLSEEEQNLPKRIREKLIALRKVWSMLSDFTPRQWKLYKEASDRHSKLNRNR